MKKITVMIPCYNEVENVEAISQAVIDIFEQDETLKKYAFDIQFIDNCSVDGTRDKLEEICAREKRVKAIFNVKNFGQFNSPFYGMLQAECDALVLLCADFQDPVELIPTFVKEWENGYKIVCGIKSQSMESKFVYNLRTMYYKLIKKFSTVDQIEHFTGFGLYDNDFLNILRRLDDPTPFLRGIVAEYGYKRKDIKYCQAERRAGKTHNNWVSLFDGAMLSATSYTRVGVRLAVCARSGGLEPLGYSDTHRDLPGGLRADVLHRLRGRVRHLGEQARHEQAARRRGETSQLGEEGLTGL